MIFQRVTTSPDVLQCDKRAFTVQRMHFQIPIFSSVSHRDARASQKKFQKIFTMGNTIGFPWFTFKNGMTTLAEIFWEAVYKVSA